MRITLAVVVGALSLALTGCTPGPGPLPIPPSPTATPVFASDEEALEAAVGLFGEYLDLSYSLTPGERLEDGTLETVVAGDLLESDRASAQRAIDEGWTLVGHATFDTASLQSYRSTAEGFSVIFYVCEDVSGTDVVDETGASVVEPTRPQRVPLEAEVQGSSKEDMRLVRSERWAGDDFC